jgi:hypothetical protein
MPERFAIAVPETRGKDLGDLRDKSANPSLAVPTSIWRHYVAAMNLGPIACLAILVAACAPAAPPSTPASTSAAPQPAAEPGERMALEGTLRVQPEGEGKFQGVSLESDRERWILDYHRRPWWPSFDGLRVKVQGERYTPEGGALIAPHLRVTALEVVSVQGETPVDAPVSLGAEQTIAGRFAHHRWPEGTKLGGSEPWIVFVSHEGTQYWLLGERPYQHLLGKPVRVLARPYEPSHFIARPGGPYLWIAEVNEAP